MFNFGQNQWNSQKTWRQFLQGLHVVGICALVVFAVAVLILEPYTVLKFDPLETFLYTLFAAYIVKFQGFCNLVFLLVWNLRSQTSRFQNLLIETSCGAGLLRHYVHLRTINYTLIAYNFFRILMVLGVGVARKLYYSGDSNTFEEGSEMLEWKIMSIILFNTILCGLAHLVAYSLVITHASIVISEFAVLARDFRADPNANQLPVISHYTFAYRNLIRLYCTLSMSVNIWVNLQLCYAMIIFFYIISIIDLFTPSLELFLNLLLLGDSFVISITHGVLVNRLNDAFCQLPNSVLSLTVSGKVLSEETYSLINTFVTYARRKHRRIYFVLGLFRLDVRMMVRIYGAFLIAVLYFRLQPDNMIITFKRSLD